MCSRLIIIIIVVIVIVMVIIVIISVIVVVIAVVVTCISLRWALRAVLRSCRVRPTAAGKFIAGRHTRAAPTVYTAVAGQTQNPSPSSTAPGSSCRAATSSGRRKKHPRFAMSPLARVAETRTAMTRTRVWVGGVVGWVFANCCRRWC